MKKLLKDKKNIVIALLGSLVIIMAFQEGLAFFLWVLTGVLACGLLDFFLQAIVLKRRVFPKSAIITGFIVSGIIDFHQPLILLVVFSFLAVISKYIIRLKNKHILNPANFALFLAALFKIPLTWQIEANFWLIIIVGIYLVIAFKKITHVLGFLIFFIGLLAIDKINAFTIISWFFLFIMLIEPKTSGFGVLRGFIFGSIAGVSSFVVFKLFPGLDFFVSSLFIANLCNPALEKIRR